MPESIQPPAPQPQVTSKKTNWKKIGLTVLIVLVVTGLIAVAYWYYLQNKESDTSDLTGTVPKPQVSTSTPSATTSAGKDETADWKTFKGEHIPIEFKIPNNLTVSENDGIISNGEKINIGISITGFGDGGALTLTKNFLGGFGSPNFEQVESNNITIDKYKVKQTINHDTKVQPDEYQMIIFIDIVGDTYPFTITATFDKNDSEKRDTINKILSTIRFLD